MLGAIFFPGAMKSMTKDLSGIRLV
jgi:hypothetical protein